MVKFIIGMNPMAKGGLKIVGSDGRDMTREFTLVSVDIHAGCEGLTTATIKCYADVEVSVGDDRMDVKTLPVLPT